MIYPTICCCVVLYWVYLIAHQAVGVGKEQILGQKPKRGGVEETRSRASYWQGAGTQKYNC